METDIFWTFTNSAWNTSFKLLFLASAAYTVYLMLNDYKPTHDPGVDTFKVEYLLGGSAVLAVVFPYEYTFTEVGYPLAIKLYISSLEFHCRKGICKLLIMSAHRFYGHSPSGSSRLQSSHSCSCCKERAKRKPLPHITSSLWEYTELYTYRTGSIGTSQRVM